jgi:hypothetical protein
VLRRGRFRSSNENLSLSFPQEEQIQENKHNNSNKAYCLLFHIPVTIVCGEVEQTKRRVAISQYEDTTSC